MIIMMLIIRRYHFMVYCILLIDCALSSTPCDESLPDTTIPEGQCCPVCGTSNVTSVPTSTTPPAGQTCPKVQNTTEENCTDECSSNDDCQYDRICCSNGCGGHVCSDPVEMCQLIQCDWPICEDGVQPITSPFSCCPFCPTTTTAVCPVKGQVRVDCATSCVVTCANMNSLQFTGCPESCQLNGCECPLGSVVNEEINTCVRPSDCNSTTVRTCPTVARTTEENCTDECSSDDDCQYDRICCSNGCGGRVCSDFVERCVVVFCASPICDDDQAETSPFRCCPACPTPFKTCPAIESTTEENINCTDECSSDDDCQYDRICCSNGCGGRVCSDSVEMCQLVRCALPTCEDGIEPETSPFKCCPFCPTTDSIMDDDHGTAVITFASLMIVTLCCFFTFLF